jgi:5-methylcytosine-specific restriction enzyme subunit McrC
MKRITVYEYDRLTLSHEHMDQSKLDALLRFNEFHGNQYLDGIARGIRFKQFVGIIQVDGLSIEVLPKIDRQGDEATWRNVLLQMLRATGRLKVHTAGDAQVKRQHLNLLEIYFELFLKEVQFLLHGGLAKKYRKQTGNVKALKGKLDFAGNIRHNLVHQERFYTTHQVYDVNHKLNQVLMCALDIVLQFSRGTRLNDLARRVAMDFPEINRIKVTEAMLDGIVLDRKTKSYEKALEVARLIILNYSPDIKSGQEKMLALLFDMNVLWEEYVLAMLKKECRGTDIHVTGQESKRFWGSYKTIRPDIVLKKGDETYIIDTKWKRPTNNQPSVEDLRQMYTYARFWNTEKVMLLYPGDHVESKFVEYRNESFDQKKHQCKVAFVSVVEGKGLYPMIGREVLELVGSPLDSARGSF